MVADRYRLDERIGSGPMGEVWRGYDTRADWVVAVKVLGARAAGAATREVLRQHAQAVARVIHPNVAMVLDVGDHEGLRSWSWSTSSGSASVRSWPRAGP
ncbi:hypothetical protein ACFQ0B_63600 [Nonomuraea thailandensis]